jgi:signal-transduction protein with cAMP-binding, CBS, and nucleotidyltransferase domain
MSKISHILLPNPVVAPAGTKIIEAAKLMKINTASSILVTRNGKLAGIVSVLDIAYCPLEKRKDTTVDEIMHSPEITIESDKWITNALEMLMRFDGSHITVVENGENIGIIRAEDILHTYRFNTTVDQKEKNDENPFTGT